MPILCLHDVGSKFVVFVSDTMLLDIKPVYMNSIFRFPLGPYLPNLVAMDVPIFMHSELIGTPPASQEIEVLRTKRCVFKKRKMFLNRIFLVFGSGKS